MSGKEKPPVTASTLRRLVLARDRPGADGHPSTGHLCLFPVDPEEAGTYAGRDIPGFTCACGAVFDATCELSSWTTEYAKRCLNAFKPWFGHEIDARRLH